MASIIQFKDLNLGGLSDSDSQGLKNSVAAMVGLNIHDNPGIITVNQALKKDSGVTVDEFVKCSVACSDGNSYHFSSTSGKVWKRTGAGVWSLEATNANGACLGAYEFNGAVFYASATKLGKWNIGDAWSARNDNFGTFTNGDTAFHPMFVKNAVLYIGDGNLLAQVRNTGIFTANALDLPKPHRIKSLGEYSTEIMIGTYINDAVARCGVFRWSTWSVSWSSDDEVPEVGVNCFLQVDNATVIQAGVKGNLYAYDGYRFVPIKKIPGDWSGTNRAVIHPNASASYKGRLFFGMSNVSGNPCLQGVYSYGAYSREYPNVFNLEYVISENVLASIEIGAVICIGDTLLISWKNGTSYGVDTIDTANKYASAYFETRVLTLNRSDQKDFSARLFYKELPTSTDLVLKHKINYAGSYTTITTIKDANRLAKQGDVKISRANTLKLKLEFTVSVNNSPAFESLELLTI